MQVGTRIRLAQVANFVGPTSGGLRVVVEKVAEAHVRAGGSRLLVLPAASTTRTTQGRDERLTLASPSLPGSGRRYHVLVHRRDVRSALDAFQPDVVEVHDQTTLTWVSAWARDAGIPSILVSHERLDLVAGDVSGLPTRWWDRAGRRWSRGLAAAFDAVVCASDFAAEPFLAAGAGNVHRIPFGVDLDTFTPADLTGLRSSPHRREPEVGDPRTPRPVRLVFAGRLWPDKAPDVALDVLAELRARRLPAQLTVVGVGPMEDALRRRARREDLPVRFVGHLADKSVLSRVLATADVAVSPGRRETFGLGILEAMACGTPVVVSTRGGSLELLRPGAGYAEASATGMASAVQLLVGDPRAHAAARVTARSRAEEFSWIPTVTAMSRLRSDLALGASPVPARDGADSSGGQRVHRV